MYWIALILLVLAYLYYNRVETFETTRINGKRQVYLHYTNWCHVCHDFRPTWDELKARMRDVDVVFTELDEDKAQTPGVTSYPTIILLDETGRRYIYSGFRTVDSLQRWITSPTRGV